MDPTRAPRGIHRTRGDGLLDAITSSAGHPLQASSSEMFGKVLVTPDDARRFTASLHSVAKVYGRHHRQLPRATGSSPAPGILFNHESPRRARVRRRKVTDAVARIKPDGSRSCDWVTSKPGATGALRTTCRRCGSCPARGARRLRDRDRESPPYRVVQHAFGHAELISGSTWSSAHRPRPARSTCCSAAPARRASSSAGSPRSTPELVRMMAQADLTAAGLSRS